MPKKSTRIFVFIGILAIGAMTIFMFSDQSGTQSHKVSEFVSRQIVKVMDETFHWSLSTADIKRFTALADGPVRKLAHIGIYTGLSIATALAFVILRWGRPRPTDYFIDQGIILIIAIADEINQKFSGGRGASVRDVFIDSIGGFVGIIFIHFVINFFVWLNSPHPFRKEQEAAKDTDAEGTIVSAKNE